MKSNHTLSFQHTHISVYLVGCCAVACITYDSTKSILEKYEINKKWFSLFGSTLFFAYLYIRPLIRRGLGSASKGYINFSTVYIGWLCSAVFLHLPSFQTLGIDVKADVSVLLTIFLSSLAALALLHTLHWCFVSLKLMLPTLYHPYAGRKERWSIIILNSMNLALACSTFWTFCGNPAAVAEGTTGHSAGDTLRHAVCRKWLQPVDVQQHPTFSSWVIYDEVEGHAEANETAVHSNLNSLHSLGFNTEGTEGHEQKISPVFTLWLTLVFMYAANCCADYFAASALSATHAVELQIVDDADTASHSEGMEWLSVLKAQKVVKRVLKQHLLPRLHVQGEGRPVSRSDSESSLQHASLHKSDSRLELLQGGPESNEQPDFLPMFPWYSGTSADMYRTIFDLIISLKLFLGRFDLRTMQAATATALPGVGSPAQGDGFTFEHLANKEELWLDFMADTGDGGDSTYAVAKAMAAPQLKVHAPPVQACGGGGRAPRQRATYLPRADVLILGGDLAYPNPSSETYEQRFFEPFEAAMPPPPHVKFRRLIVNKPDLPREPQEEEGRQCHHRFTPATPASPSGQGAGSQQGMCRACAGSRALQAYDGPTCFALPGNHDWIDGLETYTRHIPHRGYLGGWLLPQENSYFALALPHGWWLFGLDLALVDDIDVCQCRYFARLADERMGPDDQAILVTHQPLWLSGWFWQRQRSPNLCQLILGHLAGRARVHLAGDLHFYMRHSWQHGPPAAKAGAEPYGGGPVHGATVEVSATGTGNVAPGFGHTPGDKCHASRPGETNGCRENGEAGPPPPAQWYAGYQPDGAARRRARHELAPEHLIVNGCGGAFTHPTHVFSDANFGPLEDFAEETEEAMLHLPRETARPGPARPQQAGYRCMAAYPAPLDSLKLGRQNVHLFRLKNTRFDTIGGVIYFLLVVSVLPRCASVAKVLDAHTLAEALLQFAGAVGEAITAIFLESYLSLLALSLLFLAAFGFARSGGVGAIPGPARPHLGLTSLAQRVRTGGLPTQLLFAGLHVGTHLITALVLMLLLELAVDTFIRYEGVGANGYHSLNKWYKAFESEHFPDPMHLRESVARWTLSAYPAGLKAAMAVFDVPEAIAVARTTMCTSGPSSLTRIQVAAYYLGMLAYYWVLATPAVGFLFGCYLYLAVNWCNVHYDEAFSALRIPHFKGFSRLHVTPQGDVEVWGLGMDRVPSDWVEDPRWRTTAGGGFSQRPSYRAKYPSRWVSKDAGCATKVIDHFVIKRKRGA